MKREKLKWGISTLLFLLIFLDSNDYETYDKNDTENDKQYLPYDIFLISFVFHNFTLMRYKHTLFSCFKHFL